MSNLNLNKAILGGRLVSDVELKQTPAGVAVCMFALAIKRRYSKEEQTDFINCVAWRQTAEFITRYFRKGSALCVVGSIQVRAWQDSQGNKRYVTEVVVDEAAFVDSKNENQAPEVSEVGEAPVSGRVPAAIQELTAPSFEVLSTDDDLPF